ncbi:MAG TPA: phosphorylase [Sphingomonas sp.]|nr:phosphorylase [Sphingomonas sp.]
MTFIVACGLKREARLFGRDVRAVAGGGDSSRLARELDALAAERPGVIVSSGLAGALDPALRPGDVVLGGDAGFAERVNAALPNAALGKIVGADKPVATGAEKRALRAASGAVAVDMESHVAERIARARGLPFGVIRVISDSADETLPPAAILGMAADGSVALRRVLASLARQPGQLPALIRTGRHAGRAFRGLGDVYDVLRRAGILGLDLREFALDV